ncbi:MAG: ATP-binding cassette domain-containing protein [Oscillospiraceae bacterium]
MIEIKNLSKSYGSNIVLDNFNLEIEKLTIVCVMGESGKGKTTLLNIILGIDCKDSGEILGIEGKTFSAVFQEDRLCDSLTAVRNIEIACPNVEKDTIIQHLLEVELTLDSIIKPIYELSGGMKRRVAIVRAILSNSDILVMDEPFKGLDEKTKAKCIDYVKKNINERYTIIVTHQINEAEMLGGYVVNL